MSPTNTTSAHRRQKVRELMESFHAVRRRMAFHTPGTAKMHRITPSQWGVLMMIEGRGESALKDVAKALGITSSAATQLVDGLVESGYVVKKTQKLDRRSVTLTLSWKSRTQIVEMKKQALQRLLAFFEVLNDKEFEQFILLNKKIVGRFLTKKI